MAMRLELPDELAAALTARAERAGVPVVEFALELLEMPSFAERQTGADVLAYWDAVGVTGSRPPGPDAPEEARLLRQRAERRGGQ